MKHDLTTGTWQDDTGCPISIILVTTSDQCGGGGNDRGVDDSGESGGEVRTAVIATVNAIATAAAIEVAMAMATAAARWWFGGGSGSNGNNDNSGRRTTTTRQPT